MPVQMNDNSDQIQVIVTYEIAPVTADEILSALTCRAGKDAAVATKHDWPAATTKVMRMLTQLYGLRYGCVPMFRGIEVLRYAHRYRALVPGGQ